MDEEDARARIASQVSREQRAETATHVLDNSGDVDALGRQVDQLWAELIAQPPTPLDRPGVPQD